MQKLILTFFSLFILILITLFVCNCSTYNLYVMQITPLDQKEKLTSRDLKEPEQSSAPAIGDMSKAPNRNFTDVRNWGNLLYIAVDTQTPKIISPNTSIPVQVTPLP